jgi:curli biogenesis system outer membrane secretion channel CsgG
MHRSVSYIWLSLCSGLLFTSIVACGPTVKVLPPSSSTASSPPPPEKPKIVVLRLENATRRGRVDASSGEDRLWGNGIRAQIVKALEQTGRFTVVNNSGPREVLQRGVLTATGDISERIKERLGSLGDAELIAAGALTAYQLSKESKNAGIEADLLFQETQARTVTLDGIVDTAKRAFNNIKPAGLDRVTTELWLFDAKTGKRVATTRIEGTPSDTTEVMATPMQQAMRGGANKAASWIAETHVAFRAGTLTPPALPPVVKKTSEAEPRPVMSTPSPVKPPRVREKLPAKAEKAETEVPVAVTPTPEEQDWGSPPSKAASSGTKTPQRDPEEWGEK